MKNLPLLLKDLKNIKLREEIMKASMYAGLAFQIPRAISHSISYPITLKYKILTGLHVLTLLQLFLNQFKA